MSKQPYMPLYFGDFLASTTEWDGEERALYLLLLAHQWAAGSLPADPARIAKVAGYDREPFMRCWQTISGKFVERDDGRLVNARLEQHRERTNEIANKRALAGAKGAAKTNSKHAANDEQSSGNNSANADKDPQQQRGNGPANAAANAESLPLHPIQSNPIQSNPIQDSLPPVASPERARDPADERKAFLKFRQAYPAGLYRDRSWLDAERAFYHLLETTPTWDLIGAATAYCAQQLALGKVGTDKILSPHNFLDRGEWRGPFPLPATKAQVAQDANIAAGLAWLQQGANV